MKYILAENMDDGKPNFYFGGYNKKYSGVINISAHRYSYVFDNEENAERTARRFDKAGYKFVVTPIKTTLLQFNKYDEYDYITETHFEVPTEWLEKQIDEPLENFLDEYTTDESLPIYEKAILEGAILHEYNN